MKILHVNSLYHPIAVGGAERSLQGLAEAQLARNHSIIVVALIPGESHLGEVNGVKVYYVGLRNLYWPFGNYHASPVRKAIWHALDSFNPMMSGAFDGILTAEKPEVVHTHNLTGFSASVWRAASRQNRPIVHTVHDYSLLCPKSTMFSNGKNCPRQHWTCRAYSIPRMTLSHRLDAVTAISQFILDRHTAAAVFASVPIKRVIHNFQPDVMAGDPPPKKAGKAFTFGFIGQLAPAKGLELLLSAFSELPDASLELVIAGKGEPGYEKRLRTLAEGKNVRFIGVARPEDFYPSIDALVVPSLWHEPFGRVIVEAYSYGVPVLASERGGIPEIVDHLRTGILFDPDNPATLLLALQQVSTDRSFAANLARNALSKAKEFLPNTVCKQYDAVYARVAG